MINGEGWYESTDEGNCDVEKHNDHELFLLMTQHNHCYEVGFDELGCKHVRYIDQNYVHEKGCVHAGDCVQVKCNDVVRSDEDYKCVEDCDHPEDCDHCDHAEDYGHVVRILFVYL